MAALSPAGVEMVMACAGGVAKQVMAAATAAMQAPDRLRMVFSHTQAPPSPLRAPRLLTERLLVVPSLRLTIAFRKRPANDLSFTSTGLMRSSWPITNTGPPPGQLGNRRGRASERARWAQLSCGVSNSCGAAMLNCVAASRSLIFQLRAIKKGRSYLIRAPLWDVPDGNVIGIRRNP